MLKIIVNVWLAPNMVNHCQQNLCPQDKDTTKKYTTSSSLIYIARNLIYVKMHVYVLYEICGNIIQEHELYEMYNKNRI
jgi:hypothetical protein